MPLQSPTRRTVVRSAAWSVPVVATAAAAPAFAASPCVAQTVAWDTAAGRNFRTGANTITTGSAATGDLVTVAVTATGSTGAVDANNNPTDLVSSAQILGGETSNLRLTLPVSATAGVTQTVTLTFTPALASVSFRLLDVDSDNNTSATNPAIYYDNVVPSSGFGFSAPATVIGNGTNTANGFRAPTNASPYDNAGTQGNVTLNYPAAGTGSISSVSITYSSTTQVSSSCRIGLSNLTVRRRAC